MSCKWFSTKQEFAEFINHALNELNSGIINEKLLYSIISKQLLWDYTEWTHDDTDIPTNCQIRKYGCQYWTEDALKQVFDLNSFDGNTYKLNGNKSEVIKNLITEHSMPKDVLAKDLIEMKKSHTSEEIYNYLNTYAKICIVTKAQNDLLDNKLRSCLPNKSNIRTKDDLWSRYVSIGINKLYKCTWDDTSGSWVLKSYELINI